MTPEQLAKMQAGRRAAQEASNAERDRLERDEHAQWEYRHKICAEDAARRRKALWAAAEGEVS